MCQTIPYTSNIHSYTHTYITLIYLHKIIVPVFKDAVPNTYIFHLFC